MPLAASCLYVFACDSLPLLLEAHVKACLYLEAPVTVCLYLEAPVIACLYLEAPVIVCLYLEAPVIVCLYLEAPVTACLYFWSACFCMFLDIFAFAFLIHLVDLLKVIKTLSESNETFFQVSTFFNLAAKLIKIVFAVLFLLGQLATKPVYFAFLICKCSQKSFVC